LSDHSIIAIIDDNALVRESIGRLVNSMGYGAETFVSADEFLASDAVRNTRCIICDVQIPGGNSRSLLRRLSDRGFDIPIIFMTALQNKKISAELMEAGAVCVVEKPFNQNEMTTCIIKAMTQKDAPTDSTSNT
jgi:FixJ family two-component response regulator